MNKKSPAMVDGQRRYYAGPFNGRPRPWCEVEDRIVLARRHPDKTISAMVGHSMHAVQIRRCRLLKGETR